MSEPASSKPYLLRAIYEWCVDSGFTPYVSVVVDSQTRVPMEYARDGEIVLNIGPLATSRLLIGNDFIECTARFSGVARELLIPVAAVGAIYARENGHGMSFEIDKNAVVGVANKEGSEAGGDAVGDTRPADGSEPPRPSGGKPTLRRIK
jgi:stringent starvation protein B